MTELDPPTPEQLRTLIKECGVSRAEAADMVHASLQAWHNWSASEGSIKHRSMPPAVWELLLLKLDRHPSKRLVDK